MASLVKAVTILSAVLAVGVSCPNGNNPDVIDKVVIGVRGVNNTKDCLLDAPLTRVISNLHNHSLGCPDHEWGCIVNYKFGSRVPSKWYEFSIVKLVSFFPIGVISFIYIIVNIEEEILYDILPKGGLFVPSIFINSKLHRTNERIFFQFAFNIFQTIIC